MKRASVLIAGLVGLGVCLLALAAPAAAHVSVSAPGATKGGYAVLTFRVPTESDTASTTALTVSLPTDTPIASVSVQPHPGWSFTTTTTRLAKPIITDDGEVTQAVSRIDWKADSAASAIKPGEFDQFSISAGPLPDTDTLTLPAVQTYSDGTVVRWIETAAPGSSTEPEHPAPAVQLAASGGSPDAAEDDDGEKKDDDGEDTGSTVLSIVALALAAAAVSISVVTRARARGERT